MHIPACSLSFRDGARLKQLLHLHAPVAVSIGVTTGRLSIVGALQASILQLEPSEQLILDFRSPTGWRIDVRLIPLEQPESSVLLASGVEANAAQEETNRVYLALNQVSPGRYIVQISLPNVPASIEEAAFPLVVLEENVTVTISQTLAPHSEAPTVAEEATPRPTGTGDKGGPNWAVIGPVASGLVLALAVATCCCCVRSRKRKSKVKVGQRSAQKVTLESPERR